MTKNAIRQRTRVAGLWLAAALCAVAFGAAVAWAQPKEGAARILVEEAVRRDAASGRAIFVPKPKGADDSLDKSPAAAGKADTRELVTMIAGDRLYGRITEIKADGTLCLTAPHFDGEVRIRMSALDRVILIPTIKEPAQDIIALTNDDHIAGKVTGMTLEMVTIVSHALDTLSISRKVIRSVAFAGAKESLLETDFSSGDMAPFVKIQGAWTVTDGALICETQGSYSNIAAPLEQKGPVTIVLDVESLSGQNLNAHLILFADDKKNTYGRNSVFGMFSSYDFHVQYCRNGGTNSVANGRYANRNRFTKGQFRFAFDPESAQARLWRDQQALGEWKVPFNPKTGNFVMVSSHQRMKIIAIKVLPGIVKPPESAVEIKSDQDTVIFKNKDHVKVTDLTLTDGKFSGKTSFGSLEAPVDNVRLVTFASTGQERPRRRKGDVTVETCESRVTLQFQEMNDEYFLGKSDNYGDVHVRRNAIKHVRFNLYR